MGHLFSNLCFKRLFKSICTLLIVTSLTLTPQHFVFANDNVESAARNTTDSLIDAISDSTLTEAGLKRSDLQSFQHRISGNDLNGRLKNVVLDYVGGQLTMEQAYYVLKDLKPEMNEALEKNPRAKFTVNIVKDGITSEEEIRLKNMIDGLEILNPHYQEHSVTENTRLKMRELGKYFSSRYQTKNNKRYSLIRFIVNGTVVAIGLWNSTEYLPAAVGVGMMLASASAFIQYYYNAFTQFIVNAKTPAGEYARWYATEVAVSAIFIAGPAFFGILPEDWLTKILIELPLICAAAMGAQGALEVYRSNKFSQKIREIAVGTKSQPGENSRVFQKGELLGIDIFKMDVDTLRKQIRPRDYKERESVSRFLVTVSMAWAMLAVIGLSGENMFPALQVLGRELAFSSVVTYGGFTLMGLSAVLLSRNYNAQNLKSNNPDWSPAQIRKELNRITKEFWAYLFLDKHLVKEVKTRYPDWSIRQVRAEVKRLESDKGALSRLQAELRTSERHGQPDLFEAQPLTCAQFFK